MFRKLSSSISEEPGEKNVLLFEILAGERPLPEGETIIPGFKVPAGVKNEAWRRQKTWSRWWKRINHFREFYQFINQRSYVYSKKKV